MSTHQNATFQRFEKKYLLTEEQYHALMEEIGDRLRPDRFFRGTISSLYFDTPDYRLIRASLEKPVYKEKLRLRSYGTPGPNDTVFLEIKKKYKGIVYKRRIPMTLAESDAYINHGVPPSNGGQILQEIDWFRKFYADPKPAILLSYDREAYAAMKEPEVRITFDENIRWRHQQLRLEAGPDGDSFLPCGYRIMELKFPAAIPLWLSGALDRLNIYPTSFSKYGTVYQLIQKNKNHQGGIPCA